MVDIAPATTLSKASVALGIRECQLARTEAPLRTLIDIALGGLFVNTPVVGVHRVEILDGIARIGRHANLGQLSALRTY